jgi:hypothetical protein
MHHAGSSFQSFTREASEVAGQAMSTATKFRLCASFDLSTVSPRTGGRHKMAPLGEIIIYKINLSNSFVKNGKNLKLVYNIHTCCIYNIKKNQLKSPYIGRETKNTNCIMNSVSVGEHDFTIHTIHTQDLSFFVL